MSLGRGQRACLSEALGDVIAMRIWGSSAARPPPMGAAAARPAPTATPAAGRRSCFPTAEALPADDDCPDNRTIFSPTAGTLLIIPRAAPSTMESPGLPRVVGGWWTTGRRSW